MVEEDLGVRTRAEAEHCPLTRAPVQLQGALFPQTLQAALPESQERWPRRGVGGWSKSPLGPGPGASPGEPRGQRGPGSPLSMKDDMTVGRRGNALPEMAQHCSGSLKTDLDSPW